jgi:hypothetical protein
VSKERRNAEQEKTAFDGASSADELLREVRSRRLIGVAGALVFFSLAPLPQRDFDLNFAGVL